MLHSIRNVRPSLTMVATLFVGFAAAFAYGAAVVGSLHTLVSGVPAAAVLAVAGAVLLAVAPRASRAGQVRELVTASS